MVFIFLNQNRKNKKKKTEAHMFWWHYKSPYRVEDPSKPWPIILWLQGGPVSIHHMCVWVCVGVSTFVLVSFVFYTFVLLSLEYFFFMDHCFNYFDLMKQGASGVGIGNFQEVGPLDTFLKPRNSTWLKKADLLFVVFLIFSFTNNILYLKII